MLVIVQLKQKSISYACYGEYAISGSEAAKKCFKSYLET